VLMDCQMPVMDGYEATAAIRALPGGRGATLPTVALTANAMQGDEQKCLAAGMNAFLAKPYSLPALQATLARWLPAAPAAPSAAKAAIQPATHSATTPAIDPAVLTSLRELDATGSLGVAHQIFGAYLASAEQSLAQVETAIALGNAKALGRAAHALKSSSANVGAHALAGCYDTLERHGRSGNIEEARALVGQVRHEHARAVQQLRALVQEDAA
jgi:two-component system, sensor histidine kinase and response regulator